MTTSFFKSVPAESNPRYTDLETVSQPTELDDSLLLSLTSSVTGVARRSREIARDREDRQRSPEIARDREEIARDREEIAKDREDRQRSRYATTSTVEAR